MTTRNWLILTALAMEAKAITAALPAEYHAAIKIIGPRARGITEDFLENRDGVLLAGLAGGLDPALKVGDVVIEADERYQILGLNCIWGRIHGSDRVISTPAEKAELFIRTGAAAVDMESDVVRAYAAAAGIPLIIIRGISDAADEKVSPEFMNWIDFDGKPRFKAIAAGLLKRPGLIVTALRLQWNSKRALSGVGQAVRQCIELMV